MLDSLTWRLLCAGAVLVLVAGLFVGGAQPVAVGLLTAPWDKLAHATVFAVLTAALAMAVLVAAAVGLVDELHQATLPGRVVGLDDLLADAIGIGLRLLVARRVWR